MLNFSVLRLNSPIMPDETVVLLLKTSSSCGFAIHFCTQGSASLHPGLLLTAPLVLNNLNLKPLPHTHTFVLSFYRSIVQSYNRALVSSLFSSYSPTQLT